MGFVSMGGQENELLNPMVLPFGQKLVKGSMEGSMEGFPLETSGAGIVLLLRASDAVLEGGGLQDQARIPSQGFSHLGPWER
jgi:hypothetical protein